jgi:hypothetical protein
MHMEGIDYTAHGVDGTQQIGAKYDCQTRMADNR